MAKQKSIIKIEGTLGDMTFLKTKDGYIVREKTTLSGSRMATDPAFQRTRENNSEFSRAASAGKLLRTAIRPLLKQAKDHRVISRLLKEMIKVVQADITSIRGQRNVLDGETELLQGFNFNTGAPLEATVYAPYTTNIDRAGGTLTVSIPAFVPANELAAPAGATHFNIVSMGAALDFEAGTFKSDTQGTGILPINGTATAAFSLSNTVPAGSTHPLFLVLGIQFLQVVNGVTYPLKNGAYNALGIVQVSGA